LATARLDIPAVPDGEPEAPGDSLVSSAHPGSLIDNVEALVEDGRTYAEAELAFQKSRLTYVAGRAKSAAIYGGLAAVLVVLAVVVLVVGALISLIPVVGPVGATAIVFGALAICAAILLALAKARVGDLVQAFGNEPE
jgi:hypothetical protein